MDCIFGQGSGNGVEVRGFGIRTFIRRQLGLAAPPSAPQPMIGRQFSMAPVRDAGIVAGTIVDIGVADGSPNVYAAFPDAYIVAVEPLVEFRRGIEAILARRPGELVVCAAGAAAGEVTINVYPDSHLQSSLHKRSDFHGRPGVERTVPMRTVDEIVSSRTLPDPLFLKIDVEGSELAVLQGAGRALGRASGVIVEVSLDDRYGSGGTRIRDVDRLMAASGLSLFAILDAWVDDGIFVRKADLFYAALTNRAAAG